MLNVAVRRAPCQVSSAPLVSFSAGRLAWVGQLTHSHMRGGGCPEHRQASLRVNTCTDSCGRGSSPAPYSPPSAETAVGGGEGLTLTCLWEGQISAYKLCPQTPVKRGVFFCQQSGHKKLLFARQNSSKRPKQTFAGILSQNGGHLPQFSGGKRGGGPQLHREPCPRDSWIFLNK